MEIIAETFDELYEEALWRVFKHPEYETSPRGMKIKECINVQLTLLSPEFNLYKNKARDLPLKYLTNELILYLTGSNSAKEFGEASSFWNSIANPDGTVNSAYGHLIFNNTGEINDGIMSQWEWAKQSLIKDKDSRQAIMHYNRPKHQVMTTKDFPCTVSNQFFIRDNELHLTTYMRSNDAILGVPFDIGFFTVLQYLMLRELISTYSDLTMGTYTHFDGSLHIYERDFDMVSEMLRHPFTPGIIPHPIKNPIKCEEVERMRKNKSYIYEGHDLFLKWLSDNR